VKKHEEIFVPELEEIPDTIRYKPWTEKEDEVVKKYYPTKPTAAIAKYLDRTKHSIEQHAREIGLKKGVQL